MKIAANEDPRSRKMELGQFHTSPSLAALVTSLLGSFPQTVCLLEAVLGDSDGLVVSVAPAS
ncbi:MAG: hypothetical protein K1X78_18240 [Verrucomicrobiaceae bacterium]|nr:hypothetical protein [Verrucomicrobiaceae bacterium]